MGYLDRLLAIRTLGILEVFRAIPDCVIDQLYRANAPLSLDTATIAGKAANEVCLFGVFRAICCSHHGAVNIDRAGAVAYVSILAVRRDRNCHYAIELL